MQWGRGLVSVERQNRAGSAKFKRLEQSTTCKEYSPQGQRLGRGIYIAASLSVKSGSRKNTHAS